MRETPIQVAYPSVGNPHLRIALGACRFTAGPGEGDEWVAGTYSDPTDRRPLRIIEEGPRVTITEAEPSFERIPAVFGGVPRYDVEFGKGRPFALTIETGASDFDLDLGGIPLSRLIVKQGAGKFELSFPSPNPEPMELLEISSGAAAIELENLANANLSEMRLSGGAASYELDFGGVLSREAKVSIETGISGDRRDHPRQRRCGRRFHEERGRILDRSSPWGRWPRLEYPGRCEARVVAAQDDVNP